VYLGIRDALCTRLVGQPLDVVATWFAGEDGLYSRMRSTELSTSDVVGNLVLSNRPKAGVRQVSVFPYDLAGTGFDVWPAVSVYHHNMIPRRDESYIYKDDFRAGVPGSKRQVTFADGTTKEGYGLVKTWPHGRPFDYFWRIRIWSRNETELLYIEERVIDLLDERGYLSVALGDGTSHDIDTEMQIPPAPLVVPPGLVNAGDLGEFSKILTLRCEGYRDTSEDKTIHRTIRRRSLEYGGSTALDAPVVEQDLDTETSLA